MQNESSKKWCIGLQLLNADIFYPIYVSIDNSWVGDLVWCNFTLRLMHPMPWAFPMASLPHGIKAWPALCLTLILAARGVDVSRQSPCTTSLLVCWCSFPICHQYTTAKKYPQSHEGQSSPFNTTSQAISAPFFSTSCSLGYVLFFPHSCVYS